MTGRRFAIAGNTRQIEVYDDERLKLITSIPKEKSKRHNNVIFSARFQPDSDNLIYSGGWDRQVKFWDVRSNQ